MRRIVVLAVLLPLLSGCLGTIESHCTSHYERVVDAPTKAALRKALLEDVSPRVRSLRQFDKDTSDDKVFVNLLNRKGRVVMSLEMWRRDDGTWTAQQWSQCID